MYLLPILPILLISFLFTKQASAQVGVEAVGYKLMVSHTEPQHSCPGSKGLDNDYEIKVPPIYFNMAWNNQPNSCGRCVKLTGFFSEKSVLARIMYASSGDIRVRTSMDFDFGTPILAKIKHKADELKGHLQFNWIFVDCNTGRPELLGGGRTTSANVTNGTLTIASSSAISTVAPTAATLETATLSPQGTSETLLPDGASAIRARAGTASTSHSTTLSARTSSTTMTRRRGYSTGRTFTFTQSTGAKATTSTTAKPAASTNQHAGVASSTSRLAFPKSITTTTTLNPRSTNPARAALVLSLPKPQPTSTTPPPTASFYTNPQTYSGDCVAPGAAACRGPTSLDFIVCDRRNYKVKQRCTPDTVCTETWQGVRCLQRPSLFTIVLTLLATSVVDAQDDPFERTATATVWFHKIFYDLPCVPNSPYYTNSEYVRLPSDQYVNPRFGGKPDRCGTCVKVTSVDTKESVIARLAEPKPNDKSFWLTVDGFHKIKLYKNTERVQEAVTWSYVDCETSGISDVPVKPPSASPSISQPSTSSTTTLPPTTSTPPPESTTTTISSNPTTTNTSTSRPPPVTRLPFGGFGAANAQTTRIGPRPTISRSSGPRWIPAGGPKVSTTTTTTAPSSTDSVTGSSARADGIVSNRRCNVVGMRSCLGGFGKSSSYTVCGTDKRLRTVRCGSGLICKQSAGGGGVQCVRS
ncbi:hypothetical protein HDV05_005194 [Chytridiales sp. JEL 0842]|nr:hypothetical protein HDV05_005194 [Chytridiales sp. JEL 0842]